MLFEPLPLGPVQLPNRIMMSPMSQNSAVGGLASTWHLVHYGARAVGGCGLVMVEDTAVEERGLVSTTGLGLYEDRQGDALSSVARFCREQGAVPGIQLAHAGRKALRDRAGSGSGSIAPTTVPFGDQWQPPRAADQAEIKAVVAAFAAAARRAAEAGFGLLEIHAAHGYLLHQFLSPVTNTRTDEYGAGPDGRARLLAEVVAAVRETAPSSALMVRLPAGDAMAGGLGPEEVARVAASAAGLGADAVDIAVSAIVPLAAGLPVSGEQVACARQVRARSNLPVAVGGGIGTAMQAEEALLGGTRDIVALGKTLLSDPYWPIRAAGELDLAPMWPRQYPLAAAAVSS